MFETSKHVPKTENNSVAVFSKRWLVHNFMIKNEVFLFFDILTSLDIDPRISHLIMQGQVVRKPISQPKIKSC